MNRIYKKHKIRSWEEWVKVCQENRINPYENADFGVNRGGGDSEDFIYTGEYPEEEE